MATPKHKNPYYGGHEIYNFGWTYLDHHYIILSLSGLCLEVEKIDWLFGVFRRIGRNSAI